MEIAKDTIAFLEDIRKNNNRPWFQENKDRYNEAQANMKGFLEAVYQGLSQHDDIEKKKLFRIYRDVRFSKDKTPYNSHWSLSFGRRKPYLRGGYFLRLNPEGGLVGCGFWNPNGSDMALIRGNIDLDPKRFKKAISSKKLRDAFGEMQGETVKTSPKGYSKDHPEIDLLRHKQFVFYRNFSRKEIHQPGFINEVNASFKAVRPFFNYMSDILGHNLNGEALY